MLYDIILNDFKCFTQSTEQPKLTVGEVKRLMDGQKPATPPPPPAIEYPAEPEMQEQSPGNG